LVVQPLAIRHGAFRLHRMLGRASYGLMPLIAVSGVAMVRKEYEDNVAGGMFAGQARLGEYLSGCQLALVVLFYGLSVVCIRRRDVAAHMRYMICIAVALLPAGLARTLGYWFGVRQAAAHSVCFVVMDLCFVSLVLFDRSRRRSGRPYAVALAAYLITELGWIFLGRPV
jgi:hypothetical protein